MSGCSPANPGRRSPRRGRPSRCGSPARAAWRGAHESGTSASSARSVISRTSARRRGRAETSLRIERLVQQVSRGWRFTNTTCRRRLRSSVSATSSGPRARGPRGGRAAPPRRRVGGRMRARARRCARAPRTPRSPRGPLARWAGTPSSDSRAGCRTSAPRPWPAPLRLRADDAEGLLSHRRDAVHAHRLGDHRHQALGIDGLLEVAEGADLHRLDGGLGFPAPVASSTGTTGHRSCTRRSPPNRRARRARFGHDGLEAHPPEQVPRADGDAARRRLEAGRLERRRHVFSARGSKSLTSTFGRSGVGGATASRRLGASLLVGSGPSCESGTRRGSIEDGGKQGVPATPRSR